MFTSVHIYSFVFGNRTTERTAKKLLRMLLEFDMTQMGWHAIGNFQKQFQKFRKAFFGCSLDFQARENEKTNSKQVSVFLSGLLSIISFWFVCLSSFKFCECLKNSIFKCLFLRLFHYFKSFLFEFGRSNCIDISF